MYAKTEETLSLMFSKDFIEIGYLSKFKVRSLRSSRIGRGRGKLRLGRRILW